MTSSALPFTVTTIDQCVVVIKLHDQVMTTEAWGKYRATFKHIYDKYPQFVLVYDLTDMRMPPLDIIEKKRQLIFEMKPRSCRQLLAAIIVTGSPLLKTFIENLVKFGGQASPFYAYTDPVEAAKTAARLALLIKKVPNAIPREGPLKRALVWGRLGHATRMAIATFGFIRNLRHFVRPK